MPRFPRNDSTQVRIRSKLIRLRRKFIVVLSFRFTESFNAIVFRSLVASDEAPPLQLNITGVKLAFSTSRMRALYSRFLDRWC